ncbi:hypothetical protein OH457_12595 [Vibrio sp. 2art]|uniref:hypothetical protein n=2 Tax=Vibrionaceae TaxID=641 RepID=UPI00186A25BD|nr:hypothetical protein [Vibrio sp. 2art]MBE4244822.1 hypothetical protein [Vibrio parahaemolyticus]MDA0114064.1 hypothetical protein [Vibrio sp. 2art]
MSKSLHSVPVIRKLQSLESSLHAFAHSLEQTYFNVQLNNPSDIKPIKAVIRAITAITYDEYQSGRELNQLPGVVFIPEDVVPKLLEVNHAKKAFSDAVKEAKASSKCKSNTAALNHVRKLLTEIGMQRVHFKQCERLLVVEEALPKKIVFYNESKGWGNQKKYSKEEALELAKEIIDNGSDSFDIVSKKIAEISDSEFLVHRTPSPTSIKANITRYVPGVGEKSHSRVASLPIFVVTTDMDSARTVLIGSMVSIESTPKSKRLGSSKARSKFEEQPYISTLRLYRYKPEYR